MDEDTIEFNGTDVQLDENRHVYVGVGDDPDRTFLIRFQNKEGQLTQFKLSQEAAYVLSELIYEQLPRN